MRNKALVLTFAATCLLPQAAMAQGNYAINSQLGAPVRTGPTTSAPITKFLANGKSIVIECQMNGFAVNGKTVWNRISSPVKGWVYDGLTNTPGRGFYTASIPRCPEQKAMDWALAQVGKTKQGNGTWWALWCEKFAGQAYGRNPSGYSSAIAHYQSLKKRKLIKSNDEPKPGALVFYSSPYGGHVAVSLGGKDIVTTPLKPGKPVYKAKLSEFSGYLGWSAVAETGW